MAGPTPRTDTENLLKPHHRNVTGGPIRAAIFGVSDGLVTNVSLVLGVAGASTSSSVRLAGIAGLLAGSFSMAVGEYVSMRGQAELIDYELQREAVELEHRPDIERRELAEAYVAKGISRDLAERLAEEIMTDPAIALEVHAREEMGIDARSLGSPVGAALSSLGSFAIGASIPLIPWFFFIGTTAIVVSIALAGIASIAVGSVLGAMAGRSRFKAAFRQLALAAAAAAVTYCVGASIGAGPIS